jgi:hypothetical protein
MYLLLRHSHGELQCTPNCIYISTVCVASRNKICWPIWFLHRKVVELSSEVVIVVRESIDRIHGEKNLSYFHYISLQRISMYK